MTTKQGVSCGAAAGTLAVILASTALGQSVPTAPAPSANPSAASVPPPMTSARLPAAPAPALRPAAPRPVLPTQVGSATALGRVKRRPFGPGVEVEVTTPGDRQVYVFVGRAVGELERPPDWEFVKVGQTPLVFELRPNENYWIEVESLSVTPGGRLLRMGSQPKHLMIDPGSSDMADLGSLTLAVGAVSALAATVILASFSPGEGKLNKPAVVIPLYAVGGVAIGGGIALYYASRTGVQDPSEDDADRAEPGEASWVTGVRVGF